MKHSNLTETDFIQAFRDFNRVNNFEYDGLRCLYEYLTDLEDATDEEMGLDVIALCCEFQRWESLAEYQENYDADSIDNAMDLDAFACFVDDGPAFITYAH